MTDWRNPLFGAEFEPSGGWADGCGGSGSLFGTDASLDFLVANNIGGGVASIGVADFDGTADFVFWVNTSSTTGVASGTYTLNEGSTTEGDLRFADLKAGINGDSTAAQAAASASYANQSDFESDEGLTVGDYGYITSGSITVDRSGSTYTLSWDLTTDSGATIAGSFTGEDAY
jgi:hypothetical protein